MSLLPGFPRVTINMYEGNCLFVLEPCHLLTSKLAIQAVGTKCETRQRNEEANYCEDATGVVCQPKSRTVRRWGIAAISDTQLRATHSTLFEVDRRDFMVVVSGGETAGCAIHVGEPVDHPRHAHPDREHHDIPVSPPCSSKNTPVGEIIVRDRKSRPVGILDVRVE